MIPGKIDSVFKCKQTSFNMHNTWHTAPSQHSQTQGSSWAVSTQYWLLGQPKKDETTHYIFFSVDMSARFPWIILPHLLQCLCAICTFLLCTPLVHQHCALNRCPCDWQSSAWCDPGNTRGQRLFNKESPAVQKVQVPGHIHKHTSKPTLTK